MEDVHNIEVLPQLTGEVIPQGLDETVTLKRDPAHSLCPALEVLRMVNHILFEHFDKSAASVDDNGLVLALGVLHIRFHLIKGGADGSVLAVTMLWLYPVSAPVEVEHQGVVSRVAQRGLASSRRSEEQERKVLVFNVKVF